VYPEGGKRANWPRARRSSCRRETADADAEGGLEDGLIPLVANSLDDVLQHIGKSGAEIRRITPNWAERIFRWLTNPVVAGLLLMFGVGGLYIEMKAPGVSWPGIIGVTCLVLFFGAHVIIGVAQWIDVLLVVVGIVLILVEVFVFPGVAVVGGLGLVCLLLGVYLALTGVAVRRTVGTMTVCTTRHCHCPSRGRHLWCCSMRHGNCFRTRRCTGGWFSSMSKRLRRVTWCKRRTSRWPSE